ncbi:MAG: ComF family protein [Bacteroidetes bacterium]|nr:ComF family protein [Bacteroidota bacterium]
MKVYRKEGDLNSVLTTRLAGKLKTESITTLYWFQKNAAIQTLLHTLKYQYRPGIGEWLGEMLGEQLVSAGMTGPLWLIPVPIHPLKKIERGYNQAGLIARGVCRQLKNSVLLENLILKSSLRTSQTRLDRLSRWKNKQQDMELNSIESLAKFDSPHFLIIDDIITTGATIGQVGKLLSDALPASKLSVATIAVTE